MFRDRQEELERLQEQLLEDEEMTEEEFEEAEEDLLDEALLDQLLSDPEQGDSPAVYQNFSNDYGKNLRNYASGYKAYNSDKTDTDLERFSEAVREPKKSGSPVWFLLVILLLMAAAAGAIAWLYARLGGIL